MGLRSRGVLGIFSPVALMLWTGCTPPGPVVQTLPDPVVHDQPIVSRRLPAPPKPEPTAPTRSLRGAVIVIDPGHGGKDPGTWPRATSRLPEKTIALDIATQVADGLRARGARVVMTRTGDTYPSLDQRAELAERNRADLFVSIHANAVVRKSHISGASIHIYAQPSRDSQRAALIMRRTLEAAGIEVRNIYRDNLHVLREHSRPGMLIETGFLTNPGDAQKLNTAEYRTRMAAAITQGIAAFFN